MDLIPVLNNAQMGVPGYYYLNNATLNSWVPEGSTQRIDVTFNAFRGRIGQTLTSSPGVWAGTNFLTFIIENPQAFTVRMSFMISTNSDPNNFNNGMYCEFDIAPNSSDRYALYYSEPTPPDVQMRILPKPFEGRFIRPYIANTCNLNNIMHWRFVTLNSNPHNLVFRDFQRVNYSLTMTDVVDQYFQYTPRDWLGKIHSNLDLLAAKAAEETNLSANPLTGFPLGSTVLPNQGTNARWRTANYNNKWYFVHPNGRLFWSLGLNGVHDQNSTHIQGREAMFESVPSPTGPNGDLYYTANNSSGQQVTLYNLLHHNMRLKYGSGVNLRNQFMTITNRRLNSWGINTVGAWSLEEFRLANDRPFVHILRTTGFHSHLPTPTTAWSTPPDPFHPQFQSWMTTQFTSELAEFNGLTNFVGTYVDNEMSWGHTISGGTLIDRYSLSLGVLAAPINQPAKAEMIRVLQRKYRTVSRLNAAWRTTFSSFSALNSPVVITSPSQLTLSMQKDLKDFNFRIATAYFTKVRSALTASGFTGLYLGCRFWHQVPEVVQAASQSVDVLSFNNYASSTEYNWAMLNAQRKPVLISEWSVNTDEGPTLGVHGITRSQRQTRIQAMLQTAAQQPNVIGLHWFELYDMATVNRGYNDENYGTGALTVTDSPHPEVVDAFRWFASRIYTLRN